MISIGSHSVALPPIEQLGAGSISVTPVEVDWSTVWNPYGDEGDDEVEVFEHYRPADSLPYDMIAKDISPALIAPPGLEVAFGQYEYDEYVEYCTENEVPGTPISEEDWDAAFDVNPGPEGAEGPVMNYWYECDAISDDDEAYRAALLIRDLPLCVVSVNGIYGLALTGGGMDLSWEIVEAYVRLRQLPPTHYAELPGMADRGRSPRDVHLVQACLTSFTVAADRARAAHQRFAEQSARWLTR